MSSDQQQVAAALKQLGEACSTLVQVLNTSLMRFADQMQKVIDEAEAASAEGEETVDRATPAAEPASPSADTASSEGEGADREAAAPEHGARSSPSEDTDTSGRESVDREAAATSSEAGDSSRPEVSGTTTQRRIVDTIKARGPGTTKEIAARMGLDWTDISGSLGGLSRRGVIRRRRTDQCWVLGSETGLGPLEDEILALLREGPLLGYEVAKRFDDPEVPTALMRLREVGMVTATKHDGGEWTYQLNDAKS